jgi:hypothetical protein
MARKVPLRSVSPDETQVSKPKSVAEAAAGGDHGELLVAMRERIAKTVSDPNCPPRDLAALTRRLQEIAKELEALEARAKEEADERVTPDEEWDAEAL